MHIADKECTARSFVLLAFLLDIDHLSATSQSCSVNINSRNITSSRSTLTSLESPGYNDGTGLYSSDMDCWWMIDSGADDLVVLIFLTYDIDCTDKIYIYDGPDTSSPLLRAGACGKSSSPQDYASSQRYAYVHMVTDSSGEKPGFLIQHVATKDYSGTGCTSTQTITANDSYGYLTSPNFPSLYSSSSNCRWALTSAYGQSVEIDVIVSDIENDNPSACDYDVYRIYDGEYKCEHNEIRKVCQEFPAVAAYNFTSTTTTITVTFVSDSSVDRRGFLLRYRSVDVTSSTGASTTSTTVTTDASTTEESTSTITSESSSSFSSVYTSSSCNCPSQSSSNVQSTSSSNSKDITISFEVLLAAIGGAVFLLCFSNILTAVCVKKAAAKVPVKKTTVTAVHPFTNYNNLKKQPIPIRKPQIQRKQQSQSGLVRHIPPW